jgi:hypothetical protein
MRRMLLLTALLCLLTLPATADLISSTPGGGFWVVPTTWVGGVVPSPYDDVIVEGPVLVSEQQACATLLVSANGTLYSVGGPDVLSVAGDVENHGIIEDGIYYLTLEIGGDLINTGDWTLHRSRFTGAGDHQIDAAQLRSHLELAPAATGDLLVDAPLYVFGDIDVRGGRLLLGTNSPLTSENGGLKGEFLCGGNEIHIEGWSYLQDATFDAAVLVGEVEVSYLVNFTGGLTVKNVLHNLSSTGNSHVNIEGGLVNEGEIRNNNYGFTIQLSGDLVNNGTISNSYIAFDGAMVHHISMDPSGLIDTSVFLPEFQASAMVADTPLRCSDGIGLGFYGTLTLEPGSHLTFTGHGGLGGGTVNANGNEIRLGEYGALGSTTIDNAVLHGPVELGSDCRFTGGVVVADTLSNREYNSGVEAEVEGLLLNQGLIRDFGSEFTVILRGDAENQGVWNNAQVRVDGQYDQFIGAGAGIAVPEFVLVSGIGAAGHQWFRNGLPLPGETNAEMTIDTIGAADFGSYHCEGSGGELSRDIIIAEFADPTSAPVPLPMASLGQNHPNPFNPATEIAFNLMESGPARLSIHDLAGRRVALLLDRNLEAGEHRVRWQATDLPSGIYFYRLRAGGLEITRKAALLK